jgi:hypothetical protein
MTLIEMCLLMIILLLSVILLGVTKIYLFLKGDKK